MQKRNILYIITKLELGGAQKQLLRLIADLDKDKFQPFLFTSQRGLLLDDALSINGLRVFASWWLSRKVNPLRDLFALCEIYSFIKKHRITLVHTHSSKAGIIGRFAAALAGTECIIHTVHGWSFNDYQPCWLRKIFIALEKAAACFSTKIVVVSLYDQHVGLRNKIGRVAQYAYIPYGIAHEEFKVYDPAIKARLGFKSEELLVVNISCLKPQKAPLDFIHLASLLSGNFSHVKFLLVGDGIMRRKIEQAIHALHLEDAVRLAGWRRDIPQLLSAADIVVLTSLWEGLPIAILEAMASARPVVVTDTGGVKEIIQEQETGFIVAPRDMIGMGERLEQLLRDEGLRRRIGERGRECLAGRFHLHAMVEKNQSLYENIT